MAPQARNRVSRGWALVRLRAKANSEVQPTSGNRAPSAAALTMLGGTKSVSQSRNGGTSTAAPGSGLRRTASPEGSGPQAASRGGMNAAANRAALHIQAVHAAAGAPARRESRLATVTSAVTFAVVTKPLGVRQRPVAALRAGHHGALVAAPHRNQDVDALGEGLWSASAGARWRGRCRARA